MAGKLDRSRPRRRLFGRGADYVALGLIAVAAVALAALAMSGVSLRFGTNPSSASRPASTTVGLPVSTPTPTPTPEAPVGVSLLSDQTAPAGASWWAASVSAGLVPGIVDSAEIPSTAATTPASTAEVLARLETVPALSGFVVVQAGTGDLDDGADATAATAAIQALWQAVRARGGTPIVALVPPSDVYGTEVVELNGLLQNAAATGGYGVLDLYTPVAAPDGSWADTYSDDGVSPNVAGAQVLSQTAVNALPPLISTK